MTNPSPTQVYEPKDYFLTETYAEFNQESMTEQRFFEDVDYDDAAIGEMLFNAYRENVYHSQREGLSVGQSSSSMSDRTEQPVVETVATSHDRTGQPVVETGQELNPEHAQIRTLLDTQTERILAECQAEIKKHEFHANYDRRSIHKLSETIESQEELYRAQTEELHRPDQKLLHEQLLKQNWDLREALEKSLKEMKELKKFQSFTYDTIARRRLVEDQDTILELIGKIQELQNEVNCMNDSTDFPDAESVRSGHSHVTSRPVSFPPHPVPVGMPSRSSGMPAAEKGRQAFGARMVCRGTFLQIPLRPFQHLIRRNRIHGVREEKNRFTHQQWKRVRNKHQFKIRDVGQDRQPKIQSSLVRETLQRIMVQSNNDCRFLILILTNSLQRFLVGR